jgi:hypothetical protein
MNETDAMISAGAGKLPYPRCVDRMRPFRIGFRLGNSQTAQIHHTFGPQVCYDVPYMGPGYIKLKRGCMVCLRDIVMEGRDNIIRIARTETKQVPAHQACGTDDQHLFCAVIAVHVTSPAAAPF